MMITGTGPYQGPGGFDRGMQGTMWCGNNPESWVRGSATLDTSSGILSMTIDLETDSTLAGPKGKVQVTVRDAAGDALATAISEEIGMGGKPPGTFKLEKHSSTAQIQADRCKNATSLWVEPQCTGSSFGPWGIDPADAANAFKIIVAAL